MDILRAVKEYEYTDSDCDVQYGDYITSDEEELEEDNSDLETLKKKNMELRKQVKNLMIIIKKLKREVHNYERLKGDSIEIVENPKLISVEKQTSRTKYMYELVPGYISTLFKCDVTGNVTTTTPPSLSGNKQYLDLPDTPLVEPLASCCDSYADVVETLVHRIGNIAKKLKKKLMMMTKINNSKDGDDNDGDGDDDDDDDDDGSWCASTYLDLFINSNNIDISSISNTVSCFDAATAEAVNRSIRWHNRDRDTMSNINFHLPKMLSIRYVKFLLAVSDISNFNLKFPKQSPLIEDHEVLETDEWWIEKFEQEMQRVNDLRTLLRNLILKQKDLRREGGLLLFREEFQYRREALGISREKVVRQIKSTYTAVDIKSYENGVLSHARKSGLEPFLRAWMESPAAQLIGPSVAHQKPGPKVGLPKGYRHPCPYCTTFSHTVRTELDKHIVKAHNICPYICVTCGRKFRDRNIFLLHKKTCSSPPHTTVT